MERGVKRGYTFPLVIRACFGGRAKTHIMDEISVEIKIGAGRGGTKKKASDSESTQLNALIIVPLHFL